MYPGDVYGIDGPVGSIRLESIRDGLKNMRCLRIWKTLCGDGVDDTDLLPTLYSADCMRRQVTTTAGNLCG
ncbi:MAG: hypothetical protein ACLRSW_04240 [Christensenellaceae bacterium]